MAPKSAKTAAKKASPSRSDRVKAYKDYYETLKVEELKKLAKENGVSDKGTKEDIINNLCNKSSSRDRSPGASLSQLSGGGDHMPWPIIILMAFLALLWYYRSQHVQGGAGGAK